MKVESSGEIPMPADVGKILQSSTAVATLATDQHVSLWHLNSWIYSCKVSRAINRAVFASINSNDHKLVKQQLRLKLLK